MKVDTKYAIGNNVWMIYSNKIKNFEVTGVFVDVISINRIYISYILRGLDDIKYDESKLYSSKEELINSL